MRIRSIKPEFWTSEHVASLPWDVRLVFIGLWSYVDDNGVGRDVEKLIVADLFPLEDNPRDTLATVSRALARLSEADLITRYSVQGKPYLHINTWEKHQRIDKPAKGRYPLPTCEDAIPRETVATPSRDRRETLAPGTGEQGNRGTTTSSDKSDASDPFDEFWRHYPRKEAKVDARKAWTQVTKKIEPQSVIDGLTAYVFSPERKFQPLPASWLRGQRWEDETSNVHHLPGTSPTARSHRTDGRLMPWEL